MAKSPTALSRSKHLLRAALDHPLAKALAVEREQVLAHLMEDGAGTGLTAFAHPDDGGTR